MKYKKIESKIKGDFTKEQKIIENKNMLEGLIIYRGNDSEFKSNEYHTFLK
ncbi:hypothetical protein [Spiroplasma endosymbiont of Stenodema calcarata]|uniref:hypothetical protein n=1 Tax=Spiroplasma endosymbiont of Stenodema calcarata TaxID=3139328 RepID=UPI003CCB3045